MERGRLWNAETLQKHNKKKLNVYVLFWYNSNGLCISSHNGWKLRWCSLIPMVFPDQIFNKSDDLNYDEHQ